MPIMMLIVVILSRAREMRSVPAVICNGSTTCTAIPSAFALDGLGRVKRLVNGLLDLEKPIIARLPGHAIGLGCTIALYCDIIYAAEEAKTRVTPMLRLDLLPAMAVR